MRPERRRKSQTTMRRNFRSLAASLTVGLIGHGQAQNAEVCPTDASLTGFSTIASINDFMQDEILRIATGGAPESAYTITLCPNTDFDASTESLKPVLSGVNFICGADGAPANNCNIRGGAEQVRIEDSQVPDYPLTLVSFTGLTFESFGTSVNGSASQATTAAFNDVTWKNFDSAESVISLGRDEDTAGAMIVDITDAQVEDGSARTIFQNNGGFLNIEGLNATRVTASDSVIATSNEGSSFLSGSTVTQSSAGSVTSTSLAGSQRVTQVIISEMMAMEDTFFAEGAGTSLIIGETTVENNVNPTSWNVVSVRSGAIGRVTESSFTGNTGIQSGVSATSVGSVVTLLDSVISDNSGLGGNATSTPVFALTGGTVSVERTQFERNEEFSAQALAFFGGFISLFQSCFVESSSTFVAFADSQSEIVVSLNFVDDYISDQCPEPGNRLFKESVGSGCFLGGICEGTCDVLADQVSCQANPTGSPVTSPTNIPGSPSPTTLLSQAPITPEPTFLSTTTQPLSGIPTGSPTPGSTTASPALDATNSPTAAPLVGTTVPTPLPTFGSSTSNPSGTPTMRPGVPTPSPTSSPSKIPSMFTASPVITPPTRSPTDVTQSPTKRLVCPDGSDPIRTPSPTSKALHYFKYYETATPQMKKLGTRSRSRGVPLHMMKLPPTHTHHFADFHLDYDAFEFPEQEASGAADEHGRRQLDGHEEEDLFFEYSCAPSEMPTPKPTYQLSKGKGKGKGLHLKYKKSKHKKGSNKKHPHYHGQDKKHSKHHSSKHSRDSSVSYKTKGHGRTLKTPVIQLPGKGQRNRPISSSSSPTDGGENAQE